MRILFTCGGTGGHINPAIAVANVFRSRQPSCEILFVGADGGLECSLVKKAGFDIKTVTISNFQRKLTPKAVVHNVKSLANIIGSKRQARKIIADFRPDVILGTGGYASYPALRQGAKMGIPIAVHESNAVAGLTTKMVAKFANAILLNFAEAKGDYDRPERISVVGMPVQDEFVFTKQAEARAKLGLDERPYIVTCWGSLGAREMNKIIADFMVSQEKDGQKFQHTHATGSFGWRWMPQLLAEKQVDTTGKTGVTMVEYLYDMPLQMTAADLIIARAGASTIAEICAAGTPCILVPSPNVTGDHQAKNAAILQTHGGAVVLAEEDCTGEILYQTAKEILEHPTKSQTMRHALGRLAVPNSAQRIYEAVTALTQSP